MRKIKLLFLAVSIFFVAILAVAIALPQASPTPTFRARTRLVQVDVVVRDKNGPAMGLNQDDFTLLDNGKPQKISVFAVKGAQSSKQAVVPLPAGTVSNRVNRNGQEAATSTVLLIDRLNTGRGWKISITPTRKSSSFWRRDAVRTGSASIPSEADCAWCRI